MSRSWNFLGSGEPRAQTRVMSRDRSCSGGVYVTLKGWRPGLNKVRLTQSLRDGGVKLADAVRLTGEILEGREIRVHLDQFESVDAARAAFTQPERRIVSIDRESNGIAVLTTSQKLAHRIARELEKAFGGSAKYRWEPSDGSLRAEWRWSQ